MKKLIYTAAALMVMVLSFSSCANKSEEQGSQTKEIKSITLAQEKDPVCEMSVKDKVADTITYKGKIYGFCNPGCKEEFTKNPSQYVHE